MTVELRLAGTRRGEPGARLVRASEAPARQTHIAPARPARFRRFTDP